MICIWWNTKNPPHGRPSLLVCGARSGICLAGLNVKLSIARHESSIAPKLRKIAKDCLDADMHQTDGSMYEKRILL